MAKYSDRSFRHALAALLLMVAGLAPAWAQTVPQLPALNDPPSGLSLPGKFVWADLATPGISNQNAFYNYVFDWEYQSVGQTADDYVLILNDGQPIGGMFSYVPPSGAEDGATWIALMATAGLDTTISAARQAGGSVEVAATRAPGRGRHALLRDPGGALFGLLESSSGDPPDTEVPVGAFIWFDLFAREPEAMLPFYQALAPYSAEANSIAGVTERTVLSAHGMVRAGIVPVDEEANRAAWVPYVRVQDVAATMEKVVAGGGFAIVPPDEQLLDGNLAIFVDPNGGVMGIVKWDYDGEVAP